jgi:hypothetical protein
MTAQETVAYEQDVIEVEKKSFHPLVLLTEITYGAAAAS